MLTKIGEKINFVYTSIHEAREVLQDKEKLEAYRAWLRDISLAD